MAHSGCTHLDGSRKSTAPLTAITAAAAGVSVNLAVFFAQHVLGPRGPGGAFERASAVIARTAIDTHL